MYIFYQQLFIIKLRLEGYVVHTTLAVKPDFHRIVIIGGKHPAV